MSTKAIFKRIALVAVADSSAVANTLLRFSRGDGSAGADLDTGNGVEVCSITSQQLQEHGQLRLEMAM